MDSFLKELGLAGKAFGSLNVLGARVELVKNGEGEKAWFCAYVSLKNSSVLSDEFLGYPTFRKGDVLGVDTAHAFNDGQDGAEKLLSAINQIESIIRAHKSAIGLNYE